MGDKAALGVPNQVYYDRQLINGQLTVYNVPSEDGSSIYMTAQRMFEDMSSGDDDFDFPQKLIDMYHAGDFGRYADKDGTLHTCFTTNNDITGGNSGSPVMNAKGELTGIAFDGNWEAMSGNIAYEADLQKCINVDIRFVLWIIDKYAGAKNLVDEMTIVQ